MRQAKINSCKFLRSSCITPTVHMMNRKHFYLHFWETSKSSLLLSWEHLNKDKVLKNSTCIVMLEVLRLACLKFKMETVSEASPMFHGLLRITVGLMPTMEPCYSTLLKNVTSLPNKQVWIFTVEKMRVLASKDPIFLS